MKKALFVATALILTAEAVAGVLTPELEPVTDAQVEAAIDTRLTELLVKLNAQKK